jgi:hypothetical protein
MLLKHLVKSLVFHCFVHCHGRGLGPYLQARPSCTANTPIRHRAQEKNGRQENRALNWQPSPTVGQINTAFNPAQRVSIRNKVDDLNYLKAHVDSSESALLAVRLTVTSRTETFLPLAASPNVAFVVIHLFTGVFPVTSANLIPLLEPNGFVNGGGAILTGNYIGVTGPCPVYVMYTTDPGINAHGPRLRTGDTHELWLVRS